MSKPVAEFLRAIRLGNDVPKAAVMDIMKTEIRLELGKKLLSDRPEMVEWNMDEETKTLSARIAFIKPEVLDDLVATGVLNPGTIQGTITTETNENK